MDYILMHKTLEVASVHINDDMGFIDAINEVYQVEHLPLPIKANTKGNTVRLYNEWWMGRAIPASRSGLREALEIMNISSPQVLLLKCFGLSLSDHYWMRPANKNLKWEDINFFQNDFSEDVGNALFGHESGGDINLSSPDNTSDGWLKKKWVIAEGKRVLLKGGSNPFYQEPYNEVLASSVMRRLGIPHVDYWISFDKKDKEHPLSACEDFVSPETELISAWHILSTKKMSNHLSFYQFFLECCEDQGIPGVADFLDRMLVVDYITVNVDRHYNNFGAVRNPETLEWLGMAPIYDTGTSMWMHDVDTDINARGKLPSKPFKETHREQIKLVRSLDWFDPKALDGIDEEYAANLQTNRFVNAERRSRLCRSLQIRVKMLDKNVLL